jgi:gamma-glutamyltranspeptidase/glutathione hydrolase
MLLDGDEVVLALGSGGSKRIRTALLQVISNVVDFGLDVRAAVEAPRLHWDGEVVQAEPGYEESAVAGLSRFGRVNYWEQTDVYFGGVHAVSPRGKAAGDPRRGGCCVVL